MKNKISILALLTFIIVGILYSCNRTSENQDNTLDTKTQKILSIDAKKLAQKHNEVLHIFSNLVNQRTSSRIAYTEQQIYDDLMIADVGLDTNTKIQVYDYIDAHSDVETNMNSVANSLNTSVAKNLYLSLNQQIDNVGDYDSTINIIENNKNNISAISNSFDRQVLEIFIETCKASAYYWYIENPDSGKFLTTGRRVPEWVRKDGNGIAQASIGWAIGAAIYGGGPGGYFLALGVGGAISSIWP